MNSREPVPEQSDTVQEELVAYLDGELNADDNARVESRLADDAEYRLRLQQLQRAWDMLDDLPKATVEESFTKSTVEMVVVSATEDAERQKVSGGRYRQLFWVLAAGCVIGASITSYLLISRWLARPNRQLAEDLPIIEDFDMYRYADNVKFLRSLDAEGLFAEEAADELE